MGRKGRGVEERGGERRKGEGRRERRGHFKICLLYKLPVDAD